MDQRQREMIDACRPGGEDLRDPGMVALADHLAQDEDARRVFDKVQRLDAALTAAFHDAPLPSGLEERLLAALRVAPAPTASPVAEPLVSPSRRRLLKAFAGAIAASLAAAVGYVWYETVGERQEIGRDRLVQEAQQWLMDLRHEVDADWINVDAESLPHFPVQAIAAAPTQWRYTTTLWGGKSRVFRFPLHNRQWAYVFVVPTRHAFVGVGSAPPRASMPEATAGWRIGAWQSGSHLFVLAVDGPEAVYRSLIRTRATA